MSGGWVRRAPNLASSPPSLSRHAFLTLPFQPSRQPVAVSARLCLSFQATPLTSPSPGVHQLSSLQYEYRLLELASQEDYKGVVMELLIS